MDTPTAVLISQVPLGIACIVAVYEMYRFRRKFEDTQDKLTEVLDKLTDVLKSSNKRSK